MIAAQTTTIPISQYNPSCELRSIFKTFIALIEIDDVDVVEKDCVHPFK
jgi:hypothetical protein